MTYRIFLIAAFSATIASRSMAVIAHVQDIGTGSVTGGTTIAISVGATVAVNDLVLIAIATNTNLVVPTITDSRGNTYIQGLLNTTTTGLNSVGFEALVTTALVPGDSITVTFPAAVNGVATASEFSGATFVAGVAGDHNSGSASFVTAPLPGVLGGELLLGWVALSGSSSSVTQDVTFTPMSAITANNLTVFPAYKLAPSSGTYDFSGTLGASEQWVAEIESVRVAAPTPTPTPVPIPAVPAVGPRGLTYLALALAVVGTLLTRRLLQ